MPGPLPVLLLLAAGCGATKTAPAPAAEPGAPVDAIDPLIATGGAVYLVGSATPAATLPFGLVKLGPDTSGNGLVPYHCSGYYYDDSVIEGFSHTHLHGTGSADYGNILVMPTDGMDATKTTEDGYSQPYVHADEIARAGWYEVTLGNGVHVELSATLHTGWHRYTFPDTVAEPVVLFDLEHVLKGANLGGEVDVDAAAGTISGYMTSAGWFTDRGARVYFYAVVDGGFASFGTWGDTPPVAGQGHAAGVDLGAWFAPTRNPATLKVGISRVSIDGAQANLAAEDGPDIDTIAERARDTWSQALDPFDVPDATEGERAIFYTGVYHLLQMPTIQGDVDGEYLGFDEQIHRAAGFDFYSDMSLWDTYRTAHPAYTLFYPQYASDFATSLLHMAQEGGAFPRWPAANWEGGSMIGQPADIVLADTWIKGVQDWDMDSAWPLLRAQARGEGSYAYNGRPGVLEMDEYGYLPEDLVEHSVALTQELDWADDALANLATARGDTDDADYFEQRSYGYQNQWDPDEGFFHARYSDGTFDSGLNPLAWEDEFVEGNAWQYLWMPPTHADATAELLGGQEAARARLETFFENAVEEGLTPAPALYYWHGNEPDMHAAFLFALWGDRDATVRWQRWIEDERYAATPEGLAGNDDGGTLSAWYLFSTFGFYPLSGTDEYVIGAPRWAEASFRVGDGRFTVRREGTGSHVVEVRLNGVPLDRPVLHHQELVAGGELVVVLTE